MAAVDGCAGATDEGQTICRYNNGLVASASKSDGVIFAGAPQGLPQCLAAVAANPPGASVVSPVEARIREGCQFRVFAKFIRWAIDIHVCAVRILREYGRHNQKCRDCTENGVRNGFGSCSVHWCILIPLKCRQGNIALTITGSIQGPGNTCPKSGISLDIFFRERTLTSSPTTVFRVGEWLVETELNRLSKSDKSIQLEPKSMDVLVYLCRRPAAVVSTNEIIDSVWGGRPMGDNPVYKSVAKLRRALGDDANCPVYIATVAKKGYRLVANVADAPTDSPRATDGEPGVSLVRRSLPVAVGVAIGVVLAAALFWRPQPEPLELQSVSGFRGSHSQPSFAPDGHSIAFINTIDGATHVWLLGPDQSAPRQLTRGEFDASRPRWSPDGQSILFMRQGNIWSIQIDGSSAKEIIRNASNPNWSRDGKRIVFERQYQVWVANADGGQQSRVAGVPRKELPLAPRWPAFSPDGTEIVFLDADSTPFADLWRVSLEGGTPVQLTFDPRTASAPVWNPDGKSIIYSSQRAGSRTLWQVNLDEGTSHPLLTGSGDDNFPDISSDGTRLVYSNRRERFALVISHLDTGQHTVLHESRQLLLGPELSPKRDTVAFFGFASDGAVHLFKMPLSGGSPMQLTFDSQATHAIPRWSADGKDIYFYYTKNGTSFSKVQSDGGEAETVVVGWDWSVTNGASVSPDNTQAIYSRLTGQVPVQTLIRQLSSGEGRAFYATLEYPRWSQDGSEVLGAQHIDQRFPGDIAICPVAGPRCRILARDARIPMWSEDESQIYFVRGFGESQELFVVSRNDVGIERKLMDMAPLFPLGPFYDVTPNGDVIWVRYEEEPSEIWLTELARM